MFDIIEKEKKRQRTGICLIPSEVGVPPVWTNSLGARYRNLTYDFSRTSHPDLSWTPLAPSCRTSILKVTLEPGNVWSWQQWNRCDKRTNQASEFLDIMVETNLLINLSACARSVLLKPSTSIMRNGVSMYNPSLVCCVNGSSWEGPWDGPIDKCV
jgi:hypothetical protein